MKKWMIVVAVVIVGVGWWMRAGGPGAGASAEGVVKFVATREFGRVGAGERGAYVARVRGMTPAERAEAMARAGLSGEEREAVLLAAYDGVVANPVEEFAKLKTAGERRTYLDRLIAGGASASMKGSAYGDSDWRKRFLERTSPVERARLAEFVSALGERRRELGLPE